MQETHGDTVGFEQKLPSSHSVTLRINLSNLS